jgi:membrane protein
MQTRTRATRVVNHIARPCCQVVDMRLKAVIGLTRDTYHAWSSHNRPRLAAALAYCTIFSLAPLLVIIIAIAGLPYGK